MNRCHNSLTKKQPHVHRGLQFRGKPDTKGKIAPALLHRAQTHNRRIRFQLDTKSRLLEGEKRQQRLKITRYPKIRTAQSYDWHIPRKSTKLIKHMSVMSLHGREVGDNRPSRIG